VVRAPPLASEDRSSNLHGISTTSPGRGHKVTSEKEDVEFHEHKYRCNSENKQKALNNKNAVTEIKMARHDVHTCNPSTQEAEAGEP
jgi:hypothetical protein